MRTDPNPKRAEVPGGESLPGHIDAQTTRLAKKTVEQTLLDKRPKIYSRAVSGRFAQWRIGCVVLTQLVFYGLPWLSWNDRQAVLFDLGARKFYLFGLVLWPQDVVYLAALLIIAALALFLFTAVAGRLFCGYACPQTVYTEIFMWIERRVEGDRWARIRLDASPWSGHKLKLKLSKHLLWMGVAAWTGFTFIGYFAPIRHLGEELFALRLGSWQWFWILFYSVATWGNAGFMRESVCQYMCPYARFQSVMVDPHTLVVTYDAQRGEPRGGRSRKINPQTANLGDCVDCSLCVQVCPTGIDIRHGLQYLCIGCGACIDACQRVMQKMHYAPDLIRYTSEHALQNRAVSQAGRAHWWRPRVLIYAALILLLGLALISALMMRPPLRVDIIRDRGGLGREVAQGRIENVYRVNMINTSNTRLRLQLSAHGLPALTVTVGRQASDIAVVDAVANQWLPMVIQAPAGVTPGSYPIVLRIQALDTPEDPIEVYEAVRFYIPH